MHFLINADDKEQWWYCWHLSKEFFDNLKKYGPPPIHLDYTQLMDTIAENKDQLENLNAL